MKLLAREIASGLVFPEGPVALPDGTILVVEIGNGRLTRVAPSGRCETVAARTARRSAPTGASGRGMRKEPILLGFDPTRDNNTSRVRAYHEVRSIMQ
jgi:sugar lactone lactonase YvrE